MEHKICMILRAVGIAPHMLGYVYLKDAVRLCLNDSELLFYVTKGLYPLLASLHQTSVSRIERSMRHAISVAYQKSESGSRHYMFAYGKPTNTEFIALLTEYLKLSEA